MSFRLRILVATPLLALALMHPIAASAELIEILRENFNDVNGINAAGGVRTVTDILANDPSQLPNNTTQVSSGASPNVRREDNEINTNTGARGFDSFFQSKFLVLGDDSGQIGGNPSGGQEDTAVLFPFTLPDRTLRIRVSFDYALDGRDDSVARADRLAIAILGGPSPVLVERFSSDNDLGASGHFSSFFDVFVDLDPAIHDYDLRFRLNETSTCPCDGTTNTAAGIDNVRIVAQVAEPSSGMLLGLGLTALAALRRRRASGAA